MLKATPQRLGPWLVTVTVKGVTPPASIATLEVGAVLSKTTLPPAVKGTLPDPAVQLLSVVFQFPRLVLPLLMEKYAGADVL